MAPAGPVMLVAWGEHAERTRERRTGAGAEGGAAFLSGWLLCVGKRAGRAGWRAAVWLQASLAPPPCSKSSLLSLQ